MIEEIKELIAADKAKKKCYESCEADAGYFCHNESVRLEEAEKDLQKAIISLIDSRVAELGLIQVRQL
jgi:hypothetical protein